MEPAKTENGWDVLTGGTTITSDLGTSAVVLSTYSGFGKAFSIVLIFNSQEHVGAIDAFVTSIVFAKPAAQQTTVNEGNSDNAAILGTWGKSAGAHMTYGDPVAAGMAGYSKDQYTFNANGTYSFVSKVFRMSYDKIILVRESGTYQVAGAGLTVMPKTSVVEAWSKQNGVDKWGKLLTRQTRPLEKVTYRFTKHYFSGIDQWNLVLQADNATDRDGPFSNNKLFPNAWYYAPISANNPVVELP
jgi:hypothetical protein